MKKDFLNKYCKLTYQSGFVIDGMVKDADDQGVTFESKDMISFIAWQSIRDIKIIDEEGRR